MAQYYSAFFQSGLHSSPPSASPSSTLPSPNSPADSSLYFTFGKSGSLRKPAPVSFLSMDAPQRQPQSIPSDAASEISSVARAPSSSSSVHRRTNRSQALAALEGSSKLRTVPESRSFVPFDSDDEDQEDTDPSRYPRYVERSRATPLPDHTRQHAPAAGYARSAYAVPPPSAPSAAYNFIDLDDDTTSVRTRSTTRRRSSLGSVPQFSPAPIPAHAYYPTPPPSNPKSQSPAPSTRSRRSINTAPPHAHVPAAPSIPHSAPPPHSSSRQRTRSGAGWPAGGIHIASPA